MQPPEQRLVTEAAISDSTHPAHVRLVALAKSMDSVAPGTILACPLNGTVSTSAALPRPSARTDIFFIWRSTVQPTNMLTGDLWEQPA